MGRLWRPDGNHDTIEAPEPEPQGRAAIIEALGHMNHTATRRIPKVGNDDLPTAWDRDHKQINVLLTLLELAE